MLLLTVITYLFIIANRTRKSNKNCYNMLNRNIRKAIQNTQNVYYIVSNVVKIVKTVDRL